MFASPARPGETAGTIRRSSCWSVGLEVVQSILAVVRYDSWGRRSAGHAQQHGLLLAVSSASPIDSRQVIGQGQGIVMERYNSTSTAFNVPRLCFRRINVAEAALPAANQTSRYDPYR